MNKNYTIKIGNETRELPICKVNDNLYIAAFDMFGDNEIVKQSSKLLLNKINDFDIIVTPEAKAIPLAYQMSLDCGKPYIVVRKKVKAYMEDPIELSVKSITTFDTQHLVLDKKHGDMLNRKRILIVDDVISTGASLNSVEEIINKCGGQIVGKCAVLAEGNAKNRNDIIFLDTIPLFNGMGDIIN